MDKRERADLPQEALISVLQGWQSGIWSAMPGIIESFNPAEQTAVIKVAIQLRRTHPGKPDTWETIKPLLDCPVYFPAGGNVCLTFPVTAGDECLVVFASRCIDYWWAYGEVGKQMIYRMHDLSDGFAFVGFSSKPKVISNISTDSTQLRTDDGATFIDLKSGNITVTGASVVVNATTANVNASTSATITSPSIILKNTGAAIKKLVNEAFITLFNNHTHSGVATGAGNTGGPNATAGTTHTTSVTQAE